MRRVRLPFCGEGSVGLSEGSAGLSEGSVGISEGSVSLTLWCPCLSTMD